MAKKKGLLGGLWQAQGFGARSEQRTEDRSSEITERFNGSTMDPFPGQTVNHPTHCHGNAQGAKEGEMGKSRFQELEIWKMAIDIACGLFDISEQLRTKKFYRFAEQIQGTGISIANAIAEGSGSPSKKEFLRFLDKARGSTFENANMLILLNKRNLVPDEQLALQLDRLDHIGRMIINFQKALKEKGKEASDNVAVSGAGRGGNSNHARGGQGNGRHRGREGVHAS